MSKAKSKKSHNNDKIPMVSPILLYTDRIENIEICADTFLPIALQAEKRKLKELEKRITEATTNMISNKISNSKKKKVVIKAGPHLYKIFEEVAKIKAISQPDILKRSLFLMLFSIFDAYTGELIRFSYLRKPELMKKLEYSFTAKDIIDCKSVKEFSDIVIEKELDTLRRESYPKQFKIFENRFDVPLTKFANWPSFVECSQRRNVLTHCDGKVTRQYISVCKKEGYKFEKDIKVGNEMRLDSKYFFNAISLFYEVGLKLGQVLWRKQFPKELEYADKNLIETIYNLMVKEKWELAKNISKFALKEQPKIFNDEYKRIYIVNYAQAYKWSGDNSRAIKIISDVDWSSSTEEFKLAVSIIKDEFKSAAKLMEGIGRKGTLINKEGYIEWPLFREFRKSEEFLRVYKRIFRKDFTEVLKDRIEKDSEKKKRQKHKLLEE